MMELNGGVLLLQLLHQQARLRHQLVLAQLLPVHQHQHQQRQVLAHRQQQQYKVSYVAPKG